MKRTLTTAFLIGGALGVGAASAANFKTFPYDGARLLAGQQVDLYIQAENAADMQDLQAMLNGKPITLSAANGQATQVWTQRGLSLPAGEHELVLNYQSAAGQQHEIVRWNVVTPSAQAKAKNVILFIGDGMGVNTVNIAKLIAHPWNPKNGTPTGQLAMQKDVDALGIVETSSYDTLAIDSAAGASAINTGQKTPINYLAASYDQTEDVLDNPRVEMLTEILRRTTNKRIGIVSDASGTDATPAAFATHTSDRNEYFGIADQFFQGDVNPEVLMFGGGADFIPRGYGDSDRPEGDDTNWLEWSKANGYTVVEDRTELLEMPLSDRVFGLFHRGSFPSYLDRELYKPAADLKGRNDLPYLWDMTEKAVEVLERGDDGFFLMVEAGVIDHTSHNMDWQRASWNVMELDRAVEWAKAYADKNPDTLVLVTADHAFPVSVFGAYDATQGSGQRNAVGLANKAGFTTYGDQRDANGLPLPSTKRTLAVGYASTPDYCETYLIHEDYESPTTKDEATGKRVPKEAICDLGAVRRTGNLPETQNNVQHSADPVPLYAFGAGAEVFNGVYDQTDIFFKLADVMGVDATK